MDARAAAWYIATKHPHGVSQTRLLKLLWLAELRHFLRTGKRLTKAVWFRFDFGPYSKDVVNSVKTESSLFTHETVTLDDGKTMPQIRAKGKPKGQVREDQFRDLDDTVWRYQKFGTQEIVAEVYADPFFQATAYGADFDFDALRDSKYLQVPAEVIAEAKKQPTKSVASIREIFEE